MESTTESISSTVAQAKSLTPTSQTTLPSTSKKNSFSPRKTKPNTGAPSQPKQSREAKRKRWIQKSVPKQKPIAPPKPNAKEYISVCCSIPAHKPRAGQQETSRDPESGKSKSVPKGLGHWRCGGCGKACKVSAQKPCAREEKNSGETIAQVLKATLDAFNAELPGVING